MSSFWGKNIRISIFGQSHSEAIGVTVDGLPAGFRPDLEKLNSFMQRRAPGQSKLTTPRREADAVEFVSGIANGALCGAPLCAMIHNTNVRPGDYSEFSDSPRPGHADFTASVKYGGNQDQSGGGHFSGRLTAPLCIAGALCMQILEEKGIRIAAHIESIAGIRDKRFDPVNLSSADFDALCSDPLTVIDGSVSEKMAAAVDAARLANDSVGGIIECAAIGLPVGIGDPMFDGMENIISSIVFGIPAVKGIEFGSGFECAEMLGSTCNDAYHIEDGAVRTATNNNGGILGGITNGMPLIFRVAIKPTPSISKAQQTVSLSQMAEKTLEIKGRHDPCIVPRAVPCIEAAAAIAIYDALRSKI